jgi:potassium-dependent mechanosensitive channel
MRSKGLLILFCLVQLCGWLTFGSSVTIAQTSDAADVETQPTEQTPPAPELQDIVPLAANLGNRLETLNGRLAELQTTEQVDAELAPVFEVLDKLTERLYLLKKAATPDFGQLRGLKSDIELEEKKTKRILTQITGGIGVIEDAIDEWRLEEQKWIAWRNALSRNNLYGYVKPTFVSVEKMFRDVQRTIEKHLKPILTIQQKTWQAQNRILDLKQRVDSMIVAMRGEALGTATPFLFSKNFLEQFDRGLIEAILKGIQSVPLPRPPYLAQKAWILVLQGLLIVAMVGVLRRRPELLKRSAHLEWFVNRPVSTGCFAGVFLSIAFFESIVLLWLLMLFVIIIATERLLIGMVRQTWLKRSILGLLTVQLMIEVFDFINLPAPLMRLFVVAVAVAGLMILAGRAFSRGKHTKPHTWFLRLCILIFAVALVAELFGYSRLAEYLLFSSITTIFLLVLAWMAFRLLRGVTEVLIRSQRIQKFALIRNNTRKIIAKTELFCAIAAGLWLLAVLMETWKIYADVGTALSEILAIGLDIGERHFSIGLMLAAGIVLYGAFLFSWAIQSLMLDGVILSRKMQQGVRISMARLVHYAVVLVGFLVTLSVLGFDFTNIAIIGGALGVGIGFGMQTIVNNFVCGLIMLFERPVKVGDSVEFGTQQGRVKQVGLRATVVVTYDNAEIVVPNADLITSQVTNWTLAERRRRLKLPVGVAYGSDVALVIQTLMECAEDHVLVLSNPKPAVIFFGFGASSLDFELRVWIADFDSRRLVQSEINQDIDQRFRELDIEIPFPQQDLHLRSVAPSVSGMAAADISE